MCQLTRYAVLMLAFISGCQPREMEDRSTQVRSIIERHNSDLVRWYRVGLMDSVASLFTVDARQMAPNSEPLEGRAAIRAFWEQVAGLGTWTVQLDTRQVTAFGPLAVERGTYTLHFEPGSEALPGMTASADTGTYIVQWRREDGHWLIANDIATSQRRIDSLCEIQ